MVSLFVGLAQNSPIFSLQMIVFCFAKLHYECEKIQQLLDFYEEALGQMINRSKTKFFSKNTNAQTMEEIKLSLRVPAI